jgi:hypothetical protein
LKEPKSAKEKVRRRPHYETRKIKGVEKAKSFSFRENVVENFC